jgi:ABC-type transport system substrate-binding protein
VEACEAVVQY